MRRLGRSESGYLLIEVIISIALTSMVILGLAVGLVTAVRSSTAADRQQAKDSALSSAAESIRSMDYPTPAGTCPTASEYQAAFDSYVLSGLGWSAPDALVAVDQIEHWDPVSGSFGSACPVADPSVHRLTLELTFSDGTVRGQTVVGRL